MARAVPHVFTIAPGLDFAAETVAALLDGRLTGNAMRDDPLVLAQTLIYVPTQRMRRLLEQAFAAAFAPRPALLPRIRPLAEPQDVLDAAISGFEDGLTDLSTARIPDMARRFMLLPAIRAWRSKLMEENSLKSPDFVELFTLATALGRLIDEARIEGVPLNRLETVKPQDFDPARFDEYWLETREFLSLAARQWPELLATHNAMDVMQARIAGIEAEAERLARIDPKTPILVIGSTGSVQATARLMRAVARLDYGAVILPGLDRDLDAESWSLIGAKEAGLATRFAHPQASLKRTLKTIGLEREDVIPLGNLAPRISIRNHILSESLRPAETSRHWQERRKQIPVEAGLEGLRIVLANDEREEAEAIALLMRETLETPQADVALVTADRALAAYVQVSLSRWGITAQDSAGEPLGLSIAGSLLRLMLEAAEKRDGASLLALLRHPLTRLDEAAESYSQLVDALEIAVLRGRNFTPTLTLETRVLDALATPPAYPHPAFKRLDPHQLAALPAFAKALDTCLAPFTFEAANASLSSLASEAWESLLRLTRQPDGASTLDGEASALALHGLLMEVAGYAEAVLIPPVTLSAALTPMMMERSLPPDALKGHPRVMILGALESRLIMPSRLILGGLNEGSFPPVAAGDPFLNRAMRDSLGLQAPERRIGQNAHDFTMLAAHPDVILTRARRVGGQPTLPSRFLRRLEAFLGSETWDHCVKAGQIWCDLTQKFDPAGAFSPLLRPSPIPAAPIPRLPARLSITEIGTLRRDPYALYARHLLKLIPLDPVDPPLDGRERGTLLHDILYAWCNSEDSQDASRAEQSLRDIGVEKFRPFQHEVEFYRFWWQKFIALIPKFIAFHTPRLESAASIAYELRGKAVIPVSGFGDFPLSGKADRLEIGVDGGLTIIDYKSGSPPTNKQVITGLEPQLTITAAIAKRGGFEGVAPNIPLAQLAYLPIGGDSKKGFIAINTKGNPPLDELAEQDWARLSQELAGFAAGTRGYTSRLKAFKTGIGGDYDHLARVKEWSLTRDENLEDEEAGASGEESDG